MGHKVHPKIFRINQLYTWDSKWISRKNYQKFLEEDVKIRAFLKKTLRSAGVDKVDIERTSSSVTILIHAAKPGMIIGRGGQGAEELKKKITEIFRKDKTKQSKEKHEIKINIQEVAKPFLSANIMAEAMAMELEKRMPFRRVIKQALDKIEKAGALGGKVAVSGRLNGADIARREKLAFGKVPLQNLRADIDFGCATAFTASYGTIGIKVWIYRSEVFRK